MKTHFSVVKETRGYIIGEIISEGMLAKHFIQLYSTLFTESFLLKVTSLTQAVPFQRRDVSDPSDILFISLDFPTFYCP